MFITVLFSNTRSSQPMYLPSKIKLIFFAFYLSVTYCQFQFPVFVSFYSIVDERWLK